MSSASAESPSRGCRTKQLTRNKYRIGVSMAQWTKLTASDGHELDAYVAAPEGTPIGVLVLVQEIFGLNPHIQRTVDAYAKDGFFVVAPALFDRQEKGVQIGYEGEDLQKAYGYYQ